MAFITVNQENIDREHICCAITDKKGESCVSSKKAWMKERFADGLVFCKLDVRGKVFIEYIPAEAAWCPLEAGGYMHINCFWVSGRYKGQGYANLLLERCIRDAREQGKWGLTVISSPKKQPYLSDPEYLKYKGFQVADTASPFFELLYLPFSKAAPIPHFKDCAKESRISEPGMVLYYTGQCPFAAKYVPIIEELACKKGKSLIIRKIETTEQAQSAPAPVTNYSFFNSGQFITNEIFSEKKFAGYLEEMD